MNFITDYQLERYILDTKWEDLPQPVQERARVCALDLMMALILGGYQFVQSNLMTLILGSHGMQFKAGVHLANTLCQTGSIPVVGSRETFSLLGAVMAMGHASNSFDIDDGYTMVRGHPGTSFIAGLLSAALDRDVTYEEFLTTLVIAYDVAIRNGLAEQEHYGYLHSTGTYGAVATCAAMGRLLGFTKEQLNNAISIADFHAPLTPVMRAVEYPSMNKDGVPFGALVGAMAVFETLAGSTGRTHLLELEELQGHLSSLGREFGIMKLYFKPYTCCRWAHQPIAAIIDLKERFGFCLAAAIPAVLYYLSVFISVDLEARRTHLKTVDASQVPKLGPTLKRCYPLLLPIATLIFLLVIGYTALKAALYATVVMCLTSFLSKETRLTWKRVYDAICQSAYNSVTVCIACAVCGIVTGVITMTGLGLKLSNVILRLSGGDLMATLLLTMVASIILGMGLPTTAKYIVLSAVAAPAVVELGVPLVGAHLFILYFGVIAEVTPPVALTSYAAAAVAKSPNGDTALQGLKISSGACFIPFMFCFYPALLFENVTPIGMITGLLCSFIGVACLSATAIGYYFGDLKIWQRIIMFSGVALVMHTAYWSDFVGFAILILMAVYQKFRQKHSAPTAA